MSPEGLLAKVAMELGHMLEVGVSIERLERLHRELVEHLNRGEDEFKVLKLGGGE